MSRIVRFGPSQGLVGILTGSSGPILLLPNAGLIPRAGPFRLHVELGEHLQSLGMRTFRFDVPGVGEAPRLAGVAATDAIIAAIDQLESEYGPQVFVAGGVCSAADWGWNAAVRDDRISGILMLDGISFLGPWYTRARMLKVLRRAPWKWIGVIARLAKRLMPGHAMRSAAQPAFEDYREWPSHDEARDQFSGLVARGVRSLWIYTGGYSDRFLDARQFEWSFGPVVADPSVSLNYWPDCDHTFFARTHRDRLIETVGQWLKGAGMNTGRLP